MKKQIELEDNDFGFTFEDTTEVESRIDIVMEMIEVLLKNLEKNPESKTIVWPDRAEKIKKFRDDLHKAAYK